MRWWLWVERSRRRAFLNRYRQERIVASEMSKSESSMICEEVPPNSSLAAAAYDESRVLQESALIL